MPISFSCESCKKKVKAPDGAGGKWGKCPECGHRCYVPMPASAFADEDELTLAPVDEKDETKFGELMRETHSLTQNILHETGPLEDEEGSDNPNDAERRELIKQIIIYLQLIAHGELEHAQHKLQKVARFKDAAREILKKMAAAERPEPELADVSPKLLRGLLKDLHAKLA